MDLVGKILTCVSNCCSIKDDKCENTRINNLNISKC